MSEAPRMLDRRRLMGNTMQIAGACLLTLPTLARAVVQAGAQDKPANPPNEQQQIDAAKRMLAQANRILAHEGALDIVGHVSVRHPTRPKHYLLSRSRNADQVSVDDIIEFDADNNPVTPTSERLFGERFIHGALYGSRPDVGAVLHSHSPAVLPFTVSDQPFRPAMYIAALMGGTAPVWDPRDKFGDDNDGLIESADRARDLARVAGDANVILMRGHGYAAAQAGLVELTFLAVSLITNANVQRDALAMGGKVKTLSEGEIAASLKRQTGSRLQRLWDYWLTRADLRGL